MSFTETTSALTCCHLLAKFYQIKTDSATELLVGNQWRAAVESFSKKNNIRVKVKSGVTLSSLKRKSLPIIFQKDSGDFILLAKISDSQALLQNPFCTSPEIISLDDLSKQWSGVTIGYAITSSKFDISWFLPEFLRHKNVLINVLFLSLTLQLMGLISPLFFQVVMDKVLVHHTLSTLDVLAIVLTVVGVFEVMTKSFREYLFSHTTNKIDILLGMKLFKQVTGLPLSWFKHRHTGNIISRILELDTLREFLTGTTITLAVDIIFSVVFLVVMLCISPLLTGVILLTFPFYILLAVMGQPHIRARTEKQYHDSAVNTSFLSESVSGAETIKSLAIEPTMKNHWEKQVADVSQSTYRLQKLNILVSQCVVFLQRLSSVLVIWIGAHMVMSLQLTIGQLIAFNMLLSQVLQPVSGFVDFFQKYIQTRVGIDNLGDILNTPTENGNSAEALTKPLEGNIVLNNVTFKYRPDLPPVLNNISLDVKAGEMIGIVGPSGSGKSTLARLIQKLYLPDDGEILIDRHPLGQLDSSYLRSQIGVVLQENYLFSMSVRQNIALRCPLATLDNIVYAARLAGADEFILKLPLGYDTILSEAGRSLSGGQRQRIAIARTLLTNPRILIFDEATSALDEESQVIIQKNMQAISQGRTVIIVAHRLSTIRYCDRIVVLANGSISEVGSHTQLLEKNGCYSRLWLLQKALGKEENIL